jgi:hypothetical protein
VGAKTIYVGDLEIPDPAYPVYLVKKKNRKELDRIDKIYRINKNRSPRC